MFSRKSIFEMFESSCFKHFEFLINKYNFKLVKSVNIDNVVYMNVYLKGDIRFHIGYETREQEIGVYLCKAASSEEDKNFITHNNDYINLEKLCERKKEFGNELLHRSIICVDIQRILFLKSIDVSFPRRKLFCFKGPIEDFYNDTFSIYADLLEKYFTPILNGDISIFNELNDDDILWSIEN